MDIRQTCVTTPEFSKLQGEFVKIRSTQDSQDFDNMMVPVGKVSTDRSFAGISSLT